MSYLWSLITDFVKGNWMPLLLAGVLSAVALDYRSTISEVAQLRTEKAQLAQALKDQEKENKTLREDIDLRSKVNFVYLERRDAIEQKSDEADRLLEQGRTESDWYSLPYPDSVFNALRVLDQEAHPRTANDHKN